MDDRIRIAEYRSPCGVLLLGVYDNRLCLCDWADGRHRASVNARLARVCGCGWEYASSECTAEAMRQLDEYFAGIRREFDVPLQFFGTDFQQEVWESLRAIPYGGTESYSELARRLGRPSSVRAVANANGANALSLFIPCHRVIGSDGSLTGYAGGLDAKCFLLSHEASVSGKSDGVEADGAIG